MTRRALAVLATLTLFCGSSSGHPSDIRYAFTWVIDGVPYVIINHGDALDRTQAFLLHAFLLGDTYQGEQSISIDSLSVERTRGLSLYWDVHEYILWPIVGPTNFMRYTTGFAPGDRFCMQVATPDGSGPHKTIQVAKVLYNVSGGNSAILLKCNPVELGPEWLLRDPLVTVRVRSALDGRRKGPLEATIPAAVHAKVDSLSEAFLPDEWRPGDLDLSEQSVTTQPMRHLHGGWRPQTYYATVISYGHKGRRGMLCVLDDSGAIIQDPEVGRFNRIMGITDADGHGSHELLIFVGSGYGGGLEVYTFTQDEIGGPVRLVRAAGIETVFD